MENPLDFNERVDIIYSHAAQFIASGLCRVFGHNYSYAANRQFKICSRCLISSALNYADELKFKYTRYEDIQILPDETGLCNECPLTFRHIHHQQCMYFARGGDCKRRIPVPLGINSFVNSSTCANCNARMYTPEGYYKLGWERE